MPADPASHRASRLFFALFPGREERPAIVRAAAALHAEVGGRGRLAAESRLHVTVAFLGDFAGLPGALVQAAGETADALGIAPFEVVHAGAGSLGNRGRRPVVLFVGPSPGLAALHQALCAGLRRRGLAIERRPFRPHLTVFRAAAEVPSRPLDPPLVWAARELCLVHSRPGEGRYDILRRWPIPGR